MGTVYSWLPNGMLEPCLSAPVPKQRHMMMRWALACKPTLVDGEWHPVPKARSVILGVQDHGIDDLLRESPTLSTARRWPIFTTACNQQWALVASDVTPACSQHDEEERLDYG